MPGRNRMHAIRPMVLILALAALLGGALCCSAQADRAVQIIAQGKDLVASSGERPLFAYRVEPSPLKPYVVRLFTPGGINVLRDAPADHLHHHALMFALGVNGTSFWTEGADDKTGSQVPRGLTTSAATGGDASTAGLVQELDWLMADKSAVLTERRSIEAIEQPGQGATLLTWRSQLRSARGCHARRLALLRPRHAFSHVDGQGRPLLQCGRRSGRGGPRR